MGIFKRIYKMITADINATLDDMEDPIAMLEQSLTEMQRDLADVKYDTASVMATAKGIERKIENTSKEIEELNHFAATAVKNGNDDDAKMFLAEKQVKEKELEELNSSLTVAQANALKMQQMHDTLRKKVEIAAAKQTELISKSKITKTQSVINKTNSNFKKFDEHFAEFSRLNDKINHAMDTAFAVEDIDMSNHSNVINNLKTKYISEVSSEKVEADLEQIKLKKAI